MNLSAFFEGIGTKLLQGTEVDPTVSRGHEFQGVSDFRQFLGSPSEKMVLPVTYVWLDDESELPTCLSLTGTWYDSRRGQTGREPEYRMYYPAASEEIIYRAKAGDRLFLCKPKRGPLLAVICPAGSSVEHQLLWLFELAGDQDYAIDQVDLREERGRSLDLAARHILELINVEVTVTEDQWLDRLLKTFGNSFPPTIKFSAFARALAKSTDPVENPDGALLDWMDLEERLFMTLERHIVGQRLQDGFLKDSRPDVDGFIQFSLGVQNRRKSRAGWALANHVEAILKANKLLFTREARTEKRNGPDFLFPSEAAYHDAATDSWTLTMLGVKTSCKDRWRQVLTEANRITLKHLLTLEPGISSAQTSEMARENLQLVVPSALHGTYQPDQQDWLLSVSEFIEVVRKRVQLKN